MLAWNLYEDNALSFDSAKDRVTAGIQHVAGLAPDVILLSEVEIEDEWCTWTHAEMIKHVRDTLTAETGMAYRIAFFVRSNNAPGRLCYFQSGLAIVYNSEHLFVDHNVAGAQCSNAAGLEYPADVDAEGATWCIDRGGNEVFFAGVRLIDYQSGYGANFYIVHSSSVDPADDNMQIADKILESEFCCHGSSPPVVGGDFNMGRDGLDVLPQPARRVFSTGFQHGDAQFGVDQILVGNQTLSYGYSLFLAETSHWVESYPPTYSDHLIIYNRVRFIP